MALFMDYGSKLIFACVFHDLCGKLFIVVRVISLATRRNAGMLGSNVSGIFQRTDYKNVCFRDFSSYFRIADNQRVFGFNISIIKVGTTYDKN